MKIGLRFLLLTTFMLFVAYVNISCSPSSMLTEEQIFLTAVGGGVIVQDQNRGQDAQVATAVFETAVSDALTAAIPSPSDTPIPLSDTPRATATNSATPTATSTKTLTPSPTIKVSPTACYVVLDNWCLSHKGCSTMEIYNKTGETATVRIWLNDGSVDGTIYSPPGVRCTMMLRPGKYNYAFDYCGDHYTGSHPLNDNWYIYFKCP